MNSDTPGADLVDAISRLARAALPVIDHPQGGKAIMRPDGTLEHLRPLDPVLSHVKQKVAALDTSSFVAYVNRFKVCADGEGEKTTIFADPKGAKLRAVIDYHAGEKPDRCEHAITFDVPVSEQWSRWRAIDGKGMSQIEFAEFIEENCLDIVDPPAATFLDLVTGLQAKKKVAFESGVRLQDGSHQITFAEEVEAKGRGQMLVPSEFSIGVPIYFNGEAYKVRCLLRYRIHEGALTFFIKLHRRQFLEYTAFSDVCTAVSTGTSLPVLYAWA